MKFIKNSIGTVGAKIYGIGEVHIGQSKEGKEALINSLKDIYVIYFPTKDLRKKTINKLLKIL